jgi:hypothetical protein
MRKIFSIALAVLLFGLGVNSLQAQELLAQVQVNDAQVQTQERQVFREMETVFAEFLNNRQWTNNELGYNEKIRCNFQITLSDPEQIGSYKATLIVQVARPVYGTSYLSPILLFNDRDFIFQYVESQPLDFNPNTFNSNLTSMLAYYAYLVIGMDYDTFAPLGGTPYFEMARNIVQVAQQSGIQGWDQTTGGNASRNRAALINALFNTRMLPIREMMYNYHRLALDTFIDEPEEARALVLADLKKLNEVREFNPSSILLISFFDVKDNELANMFTKGDMAVRRQAFDLLRVLDPSNTDMYGEIIK